MKTVLKSLVVGLMVFALSFSPALAALAKAGGFNFEGINSIKTDDTQSYEKQPRGLMFNFSFDGPRDYKKTKSQVNMSCQHLEFCHTKSDSTCPVYTLTL